VEEGFIYMSLDYIEEHSYQEMVALAVVFKRLPSLGAVMPGQSSLSDVLLLPRGFPNDLGTP
jgi:hypothetical protein